MKKFFKIMMWIAVISILAIIGFAFIGSDMQNKATQYALDLGYTDAVVVMDQYNVKCPEAYTGLKVQAMENNEKVDIPVCVLLGQKPVRGAWE